MAGQNLAEQKDMSNSNGVVARVTHAITKDGMLAAAFRQGATELATALRAFPETIHAEEPGTFLNPTQGEIASSRQAALPQRNRQGQNSPTGRSRITLRSMGMADDKAAPHRIDWRGANLRGVSMAGINLEGADLRACDMTGASFTGSNLRYADLRGATLHGTNFQNASLYGAKMQGVEANQADFRGADLRQVNFGGAYLEGSIMPPPDRLPSPSEIAKDKQPHRAEPDQSRENAKEKGRERSRGR